MFVNRELTTVSGYTPFSMSSYSRVLTIPQRIWSIGLVSYWPMMYYHRSCWFNVQLTGSELEKQLLSSVPRVISRLSAYQLLSTVSGCCNHVNNVHARWGSYIEIPASYGISTSMNVAPLLSLRFEYGNCPEGAFCHTTKLDTVQNLIDAPKCKRTTEISYIIFTWQNCPIYMIFAPDDEHKFMQHMFAYSSGKSYGELQRFFSLDGRSIDCSKNRVVKIKSLFSQPSRWKYFNLYTNGKKKISEKSN